MPRQPAPTLPLDPALPLLEVHVTHHRLAVPHAATAGIAWAIADLLGSSLRTGQRINTAGRLSCWRADELATRLGVHPEQIWGDAWAECFDS
ncbi:MAG: hypothetical protein FJ038_12490 [Chloroflexi bacterium]|nr:hypothetical protein [Chloroflexota bacterium]